MAESSHLHCRQITLGYEGVDGIVGDAHLPSLILFAAQQVFNSNFRPFIFQFFHRTSVPFIHSFDSISSLYAVDS